MYLYLIKTQEIYHKIGMARVPSQRRAELQTGCPTPLEIIRTWAINADVASAAESAIHDRLRLHHMLGEWFSVDTETAIEAIESVVWKPRFEGTERERLRAWWAEMNNRLVATRTTC